MTPPPAWRDPGLGAARTGLAWSRTALGVAANTVLLTIREVQHARSDGVLLTAAVVLAGAIAVGTALYAWRRSARLRVATVPTATRWAAPVLGWSVVLLTVVSGLAVVR